MQIVAVIGGTKGVGLCTVVELLKHGFEVVLSGRSADSVQAAIDEAKKAVPAAANAVSGHPLEYSNHTSITAFFEKMTKVDHLVLVGSSDRAYGPFSQIPLEKFRKSLDSKLIGYADVTQVALPKIPPTGSIVMVSGGTSRQAIPNTSFLAAVNGGIVCMATTLARELAPIRVNVVSPGLLDTHTYNYMTPEQKAGFFQQTLGRLPVGRIGKPEEIADAIRFLVMNAFTTGTVLDVDGGSRVQ